MSLFRRRSRVLVAVAVVASAAGGVAIGFGPYVRGRLADEAARLHCDIQVDAVRPAWLGVRLVGVRVLAVDAASVALDDVRVDVTWGGHPKQVRVIGGTVEIRGEQEEVAREIAAWRAALAHGGDSAHAKLPLRLEGVGVRWADLRSSAAGGWVERDASGRWTAGAADVAIERDGVEVRATNVTAALTVSHAIESASAEAVSIVYGVSPRHDPHDARPHSDPAPLATLRARARIVADRIAAHVPEHVPVSVAALSVEPGPDARGLSFGPGPFSITRDARSVTLRFASSPGAHGTQLEGRVELPLDEGALRADVTGGPVTLAALGVRDGQAGLSDLDAATLEGRASVVATEESALLDVDVRTANLGFFNRRVALHTLHGLSLGLRAKGEVSADGTIRIDDADVAMGSAHLTAHGTIGTARGHETATLDLAAPEAPCQALLDSAPAALLPTAHGMTMGGTFAATARVALALRDPDAMKLTYDVRDACHVTSVPEAIDHDRFFHPFSHRVYSPNGEIREETTGPGTPGWTPLAAMSHYLPVAVLMTEDGGVFRRKGFNDAQIKYAIRTDLKERRFARGASTMTMQLAKNLFLSRDKVLARKLEEVILTKYLSERFTENEILELYLNVIEFGPDIYGVAQATRAFYGKGPSEVTLAESLFLAAVLPSPVKFYSMKQAGSVPPYWMAAIQHLMELARTSQLISDEELEEGKGESIAFR